MERVGTNTHILSKKRKEIIIYPLIVHTPFKLLLFILLDGWQLLFSTLVAGFTIG